ncbi:MAG: hypothetical protein J07HQX50_02872 [Haloquadratum sp. J07HQX50]|jgi:hypothetical protein|nr:MAG: hypothetical protein J07HQX50_02872 [Haloquadratum sp. J07HQX50]
MSMGSYDNDEHERRERKNGNVDTNFDDTRSVYHGSIQYENENSAEDLISQFKEIQQQ